MTLLLAGAAGAAGAPTLRLVSTDPTTGGGAQHQTEVEPDVAASGSTIVAAFQVGHFDTGGGSMGTGWATSTNGGATWQHGVLPAFTQASTPPGPYDRTADNTVAHDDAHGVWLISSLGISRQPNGRFRNTALVVSRSTDGLNWSGPDTVMTALQPDKDWIACDNWPSSPAKGTCYAAASEIDLNRLPLVVSRSTDGGASWSGPVPVAGAGGYNVQLAVQPNGNVVLLATGGGNLIASGSSDQGRTWSAPVVAEAIHAHVVTGGVRVQGSKPTVSVDNTGRIYAVWSDCRFRAGCRSNDLVLSTSTDGVTWTPATRIPIDPASSLADHFLPGIGADPATGGSNAHLGLVYYAYKDATCATPCAGLTVGYISSTNAGQSWKAPVAVAGPMSTAWLANAGFVGDYNAVAYIAGKPLTVVAVATAPQGGSLSEAMYAAFPSVAGSGARFSAVVGPGRAVSMTPRSGSPGRYAIVVRDRTRTAGFHLKGPGVNRATGKTFTGTVTWEVTLKAGTYRFFSDARGSRGGVLQVG